jgi:hypothetical protein
VSNRTNRLDEVKAYTLEVLPRVGMLDVTLDVILKGRPGGGVTAWLHAAADGAPRDGVEGEATDASRDDEMLRALFAMPECEKVPPLACGCCGACGCFCGVLGAPW